MIIIIIPSAPNTIGIIITFIGGARGVVVIVVGNGHEFKSWTRLIAFHFALIPLGKV